MCVLHVSNLKQAALAIVRIRAAEQTHTHAPGDCTGLAIVGMFRPSWESLVLVASGQSLSLLL